MKCIELKSFLDKESGLDIAEFSRKKYYVLFRGWYYYFCYKYADDCFSLQQVGDVIDRDHSTVIHGYNRLLEQYPYSVDLRNQTDGIEKRIVNHFNLDFKANIFTSNNSSMADFRGIRYQINLKEKYESKISLLEKKIKKQETIMNQNNELIQSLRIKINSAHNKNYRLRKKLKIA